MVNVPFLETAGIEPVHRFRNDVLVESEVYFLSEGQEAYA